MLCFVTAVAGVLAEGDADTWLRDVLARAVEANERWERLAEELRTENERPREENARLRERDVQREAELERVNAELTVLQRLVFGRPSERARPDAAGSGDGMAAMAAQAGIARAVAGRAGRGRGPGGGITRICPGSR